MYHIVKFSTGYNFCAFSTKYYEASFGPRCLYRQKLANDQRAEYATYEHATLRRIVSKKPGKGNKSRFKETDLLKVTKTRATQEKMNVAKLKASQFDAFAQEPGMFLDDLLDLEHRKKIYPYKENISDKNKVSSIARKSMFELEGKSALQETVPNIDLFYQVLTSKLHALQKNNILPAYFDVCLHSGLSHYVHEYVHFTRSKKLNYSSLYEPFICKYIEDENFSQIEDLVFLMNERNVQPTNNLVALYFDYLYRSKLSDKLKVRKAQEMLMDYKLWGGKVEDILAGATLSSKKKVLEVLRWAYPNLKAIEPPSYCPLVERLYKDANTRVSPSHPPMKKKDVMKLTAEQINIEKSLFVEIDSVFPTRKGKRKKLNQWNKLIDIWRKELRRSFILNLKAIKTDFNSFNMNLYPFLNCLPVDDMVNLMLREIELLCRGSETFTLSSRIAYENLGQKIWECYRIKRKCNNGEGLREYKRFLDKYFEWYLNLDDPKQNYREKWLNLMNESKGSFFLNERNFVWPDYLKIKLGKFIYDIIFKNTMVPPDFLPKRCRRDDLPGFYLVIRNKPDYLLEEQIKFHPILGKIYKRDRSDKLLFEVKYLPTVCPPKPWTSIDNGALYMLSSRFIRYTPFDHNTRELSKLPEQSLSTIFDAVNQLQSVSWVMNCDVLDVLIKVFQEGGSEELNVPINPDTLPDPSKAPRFERQKLLQEKRNAYGLWCECLYKLSQANHFRNKVFWLPYNIDFRGRVYPIPAHVNHICSDLHRSLYIFANKKPLGPKGLDWLKVHCINLCGTHKKMCLSERLDYANKMLPEILDSAENPLNGRRWWTKAEDCWQTLSTCMEIRNAIKSGNPETYETGFPVHQDGSCNGLQHYAALGRDPMGANSVNLSPSKTPQDVYEVVVNIIEEMRKKDVEKNVEIAKILDGFVVRKVVKQTIMTTVYGVTFFGARNQIANKLKDFKNFPPEKIFSASAYLANKVFDALNEMFTSAQEIQRWFLKCAHAITSELRECVSWVTPLGLPVSQPYFKKKHKMRYKDLIPEKRKQGNAFPPNFIHSLDSSHMMLTALSCGMHGLTFASIHDCFWTHPSDVDKMNVICRSRFVELHSETILENLAKHFLEVQEKAGVPEPQRSNINYIFKAVPRKGKFDLEEVKKSVYFFS